MEILPILKSLAKVKDVRAVIKKSKKSSQDFKLTIKSIAALYEDPDNVSVDER